ncbi:hypothetical protein PI125_g13345 [Phytophthora idaei]|nr:hypothetical protein PI125_g13345 [Phytophthora idaei]
MKSSPAIAIVIYVNASKAPVAQQKEKRDRVGFSDDEATGQPKTRELKTAVHQRPRTKSVTNRKRCRPYDEVNDAELVMASTEQATASDAGVDDRDTGPYTVPMRQRATRATCWGTTRGIAQIRRPRRRRTRTCSNGIRRRLRETTSELSSGDTASGDSDDSPVGATSGATATNGGDNETRVVNPAVVDNGQNELMSMAGLVGG